MSRKDQPARTAADVVAQDAAAERLRSYADAAVRLDMGVTSPVGDVRLVLAGYDAMRRAERNSDFNRSAQAAAEDRMRDMGAALLAGGSEAEVAARFGISVNRLQDLMRQARARGLEGIPDAPRKPRGRYGPRPPKR